MEDQRLISNVQNSRGVALIMVLWVMVVLSVIVLEFCFGMRTEVKITQNYRDEVQLYAMAEGGVQRAIAELVYKQDLRIQQMRKAQSPEKGLSEEKEWITDGRPYLLPFEQGECKVRIMSESGKININLVPESTLRKVIGNLGLEKETRDMVVDSILDWIDPDDFYRINGAENDYYQSLKEPYRCKNGPLSSIEELLLIRGVTPDLFYGKKIKEGREKEGEDQPGLKDLFSIYSPSQQIDINSSTSVALKAVLGIPAGMADRMVKAREEKEFANQQDLLQRIPELAPFIGEIGGALAFRTATPYYSIESRASSKEGRAKRGIKVIVKIDRAERDLHKMIQWVDVLY